MDAVGPLPQLHGPLLVTLHLPPPLLQLSLRRRVPLAPHRRVLRRRHPRAPHRLRLRVGGWKVTKSYQKLPKVIKRPPPPPPRANRRPRPGERSLQRLPR
eukprot:1195398-Prorocentrum_minimum.AAC.8